MDDTNSSINQVFDVEENDVVVLGAGGLGSWCAPLIVQSLPQVNCTLSIVMKRLRNIISIAGIVQ